MTMFAYFAHFLGFSLVYIHLWFSLRMFPPPVLGCIQEGLYKAKLVIISIDRLYTVHTNLNNNTLENLSLMLVFPNEGFFLINARLRFSNVLVCNQYRYVYFSS